MLQRGIQITVIQTLLALRLETFMIRIIETDKDPAVSRRVPSILGYVPFKRGVDS